MGKQKERKRLLVQKNRSTSDDFRQCDRLGCSNVVAVWAQSDKGPVYCSLHQKES
jgi:hypothetical protein